MKVKFSDVVRRANTKEDKDNTDKVFYVGGEHIDSNEVLITKRGIIAGSTIGPMFYFGFKAGQVLFVSRNPHLRKAGMVDFDGICSEKTFVLETIDENILLQRYLPFILQSDHFWSYAESNKSGSVNFFINWSTLAKYEFELPSIAKQKELSDLLWAINDTKLAYRKMLIATDELVKSQFIALFGDPSTNPMQWPVKQLSDIANYFIGLTYHPQDVSDDGILVLRSGNIQNARLAFTDNVRVKIAVKEQLLVHENDILMCSRNGSAALVGKVAKIPKLDEKVTFGAFMTIIRSSYSDYLFTYFQLDDFRRQISTSKTATINQITKAMLDKVSLPIPPMVLQEQFAAFVQQSDKSKFEIEQAITSIDKLYRSIIAENLG